MECTDKNNLANNALTLATASVPSTTHLQTRRKENQVVGSAKQDNSDTWTCDWIWWFYQNAFVLACTHSGSL